MGRVQPVVVASAFFLLCWVIPASAQEKRLRWDAGLEDRISRAESLNVSKEIASMETDDAVLFLANLVYRRVKRAKNGKEIEDPVAREARSLMGAIDGHGEFFAEGLERKRGKKGYDMQRAKFFRLLRLLGTDESITVLARYLDDEADTPTVEDFMNFSDVGILPSNAVLAVKALERMDIDGAPAARRSGRYTEEDLGMWRKWWGETGKTRFASGAEPESEQNKRQPPGSSPPESGPPSSTNSAEPATRENPAAKLKSERNDIAVPVGLNWWAWAGIMCLVVLAVVAVGARHLHHSKGS